MLSPEQLTHVLRNRLAPRTWHNYSAAFTRFKRDFPSACALPPSTQHIARYTSHTMISHLKGVRSLATASVYELVCNATERKTKRSRRDVVTDVDRLLRHIASLNPEFLAQNTASEKLLRTCTTVLVRLATAQRNDTLASALFDIEFKPDGSSASFTAKVKANCDSDTIVVPRNLESEELCPVRWLRAYVSQRRLRHPPDESGKNAFLFVQCGSTDPVKSSTIGTRITKLAHKVGVDRRFTSHMLKNISVSSLLASGVPISTIASFTRTSVSTLERYNRPVLTAGIRFSPTPSQ